MSVATVIDNAAAAGQGGAAGGAALTPEDLAEVFALFNESTARMREAHETLQRQVVSLKRELREANEQVERSRRLAALGEMAAGIAHEVRNPLGAIRLNAEMLRDDLSRPREELDEASVAEGPALVQKIIDATRGLDGVVCDVLHFAKDVRVGTCACEADALLESAWSEALAGLGPVGASVELRHKTSGLMVWCDATLVHRALVNLVRNAIEAAAEGIDGRRAVVELSARATPARLSKKGPQREAVVLRVRDTGPGIGPEVRERMFNPFFTTRERGTGLGLAIVHRIVDAHGGRVNVRNHRAGGAVVELVLPAGEPGGDGSEDTRGGTDARCETAEDR